MSADLLALLDQLDEARAKATPGPWEVTDDEHEPGIHEFGIWSEGLSRYVVEVFTPRGEAADAALIVAAVNALPKLTAALRAVEALAERFSWDTMREPDWTGTAVAAAITAALTPEQVPS